jgi:hypothetical protein
MAEQPYTFEQLQRWMQSVIMHRGGVDRGADSAAAQTHLPVDASALGSVIAPSQALTSAERLEIYAQAYYARLIECLRAEFPMLVRSIGEELFDQFAVDYLQRYPSASYTLTDLGSQFPQFLRETRPDSAEQSWPDFLINLAELELIYSQVFDGPGTEDLAPLSASSLSRLTPDQLPLTRLIAAPCLRLAVFDFPVHGYYRRLRRKENAAPPEQRPTWLAITRQNYTVRPIELDQQEFNLLCQVVAGQNLGDALQAIAAGQQSESIDELVTNLPRWFERWMAERFFIAIEVVAAAP